MTVYTIQQAEAWDALVRGFSNYDVYYLSGYVKAFRLHGDGEPLLFYGEADGVRGINVVMKRDIAADPHFAGSLPADTYFDFATPYGYGGWLLEGEGDPAPIFETYREWCKEHGIVSEFVRFSLFSSSRERYYGEVIPRTNNVVRALDRPMDEMLMDFEHKVRKNLKKAEASGLEIRIDTVGDDLTDFLRIYRATMDRNHAENEYYFSEEFYRQINTMNGHFAYFHVLYQGMVISTELVLMGTDTMYSYLGGTDEEYFAYRPNDFLKYHIIRWGFEHGYRQFVLGGGYGADDGIFRYKKSFAPEGIVRFYTGQAVFDSTGYDALCALRTDLPNSGFFPRYRA
ncbi:MAG: lipid II:glycine glycyltransferase FemX [Dysosmobacter sp.]|jgi:hypothetical protein